MRWLWSGKLLERVLISDCKDLMVSVRIATALGVVHSVIQCAAESALWHSGHLD